MGDFNFDLLNYATDNNTFDFLNTIVESGFLSLIHQPVRITETFIDNIFSNNFEHETLIGNLLIKISDYLPQFSKRLRGLLTLIKHKHDYKNFKEDVFLADFSIQNWSNLENQNINSCEKFDDSL